MSALNQNQGASKPVIEPYAGDHCTLSLPNISGSLGKLENFPGFSKWLEGTRKRIFRPTPANIKYIQENWPDAEWDRGCRYHLDNFIEEQLAAAAVARNKTIILEDDGSYEYKQKPFDHQRQAFLLSRNKDIFAYLMEQGTGKSKLTIDVGCYNYAKGTIEAVIIIAINGVHSNWLETEIPEHHPDWCPYMGWTYDAGKFERKKSQEEFENIFKAQGVLKYFAFNVEGFASEKARKALQRIILTYKCLVVVDESDFALKNHSAMRTEYLTTTCDGVAMKRILTGTEITKGVEDLYGQLNFLGTKVLGFDTYTSFRNHFCTMGGFRYKQIIGYKNIDELIKILEPWSYRVLKKDCLDLPPKVYKRWKVELTPTQRKLYDELRKNFITQHDGKALTATLGVTRLLRLQQITCGWFPADDEEVAQRIPGDNPKLEAALTHCRTMPGGIIVWARFRGDIQLIHEELVREHGKDQCAMYYGDTDVGEDDGQRGWINNEFQSGNLRFIVANKAMARGRTFTKCINPFIHSNDFDLGARKQLEDRTHRIGTKEVADEMGADRVLYTDCEAIRTVDKKIIDSLKRKQKIADMVRMAGDTLFLEEDQSEGINANE